MDVIYNKKLLFQAEEQSAAIDILCKVADIMNLSCKDIYLEQNGRKLCSKQTIVGVNDVKVFLRLTGGKGGFGSMLRAIGAQIEKTTNREACRDLSGRRLRDINEEQRLKNWIATQADRDKEAADRKKKKLEKLCQEPKHEFHDETYYKERSELPDKVEDAVLQGLQATCSTKRPAEDEKQQNKKKRKLWVDADLEDLSCSSDEEDSDKETTNKKSQDSSDSGNESSNKNSGDSLDAVMENSIKDEENSLKPVKDNEIEIRSVRTNVV